MGQQGFWDVEDRQQKLEQKKSLLNQLNQLVPWENFRPILMQIHDKPRKSQAGRPPTDVLLLFEMLVLQKLYNISDEELEYQVNDRLSFYKNHISSDVGFKFIRRYAVTDASVHDSQVLGELLDADNLGDGLWADSAYLSVLIVEVLKLIGFEPHINERAYRNRPLTQEQKAANRERSKTRAKVEHVFGDLVTSMGGKMVRSIGLARAQTQLELKNLVYNLKRFVYLESQPDASTERAG